MTNQLIIIHNHINCFMNVILIFKCNMQIERKKILINRTIKKEGIYHIEFDVKRPENPIHLLTYTNKTKTKTK